MDPNNWHHNWHHFHFFEGKHVSTFYMQNVSSIIDKENLGNFWAFFDNFFKNVQIAPKEDKKLTIAKSCNYVYVIIVF
jgi:hypothetical protein